MAEKLTDEGLQQLLAANIPVPQIALLCRTSVEAIEAHVARLEKKRREEEEAVRRRFESATSGRPFPPGELIDPATTVGLFRAAHDLEEWVRATFIDDGAILVNPAHWHLQYARLGFVWTNVASGRGGRRIVGQCERPRDKGTNWGQERGVFLLRSWFGEVPDFLITLDAPYCAEADDATFCALVEHECYHAGQLIKDGEAKFTKDDVPIFTMNAHSVEEHTGVVARYGVGAASGGVAEFVAAANRTPTVAAADIAEACGTCLRR